MIETLYKTQTPEKGKSECYVLVLTSRASTRGKVYAFMEEHGSWDKDLERFVYSVSSINTDEHLTPEHARDMYEVARRNLARKGFIHSFSQDGLRKESCSDQASASELAMA